MVGDHYAVRSELSAPAFVGREREIAALRQALSQPPAVVLVEAEPGAGKSRLLQEFLASPAGRSHQLLVAVCPPFREALTLGPIVDAVRQARPGVAGLPLSALAGALRPLLPEWVEDLPPLPAPLDDPKAARHRLFRALAELIDVLGVTGLVVEDVHWADPVTMEFLLFLTAHTRTPTQPTPPSLVVTYRPGDVPPGSLLLRLSSRLPAGVTRLRIPLSPLDVSQTARMVSSMLHGEPVSDGFAGFLHERTGGVPLAVEESVRLLYDRTDLLRRNGEWIRRRLADLQVSPTLRDSVLERVQRLSTPAQRILNAAAVFAEPIDGETVLGVAGLTGDEAHTALTEAVASGLLQEDDQLRLAFRHAFMGQVVYESLSGAQRQRLHLLAGEALQDRQPPPVVQLTRHFREAGEVSRWCQYGEMAAARAISGGDHTTAAMLLNDLLATAELEVPVRVRIAQELASTALLRREPVDQLHRQVVQTLRRVVANGGLSPVEAAPVRNRLGRLLAQQGDFVAAHTELEQAVRYLPQDAPETLRAITYLGWPWLGPWPAEVHRQWLRRGAESDHRQLSEPERLSLVADQAVALLQLGDPAGWELAAGLPTEPDPDGAPELLRVQLRICLNLGYSALLWGDYHRAGALLAAALVPVSENFPRLRTKALQAQAELDLLRGSWGGLSDRVSQLRDSHESDPLQVGVASYLLGRLSAIDGAVKQAQDLLSFALHRARQIGATEDELGPAAGLGQVLLAEGQAAEAVQVTEGPIAPVVAKRIWMFATELAPVRVRALVATGRITDAEELVSAYEQGVSGQDLPAPSAGLATCQAVLAQARGEPAADAWLRAAQAWERLPRPYDGLLARQQAAECLLAQGHTERGTDLLTEVWQGLSEMGARTDADQVGHRLRAYGVEVRRPWRGGRRGYGQHPSPRELEVVRLVLAGKTNREIAVALHKSPRTVAGQLASVMRKLGVSSRTELAVRVVEAGLVSPETR